MPFDSLGPIPVAGARNPLGFFIAGPTYPHPGGAVSFPLVAPDSAIALSGSDTTSGISFDNLGLPGLVSSANGIIELSASAGLNNLNPGVVISGAADAYASLGPTVIGSHGDAFIEFDSVGTSRSTRFEINAARGIVGTPTPSHQNDKLFSELIQGYGTTGYKQVAEFSVTAGELFDDAHSAGIIFISSTDNVTQVLNPRLTINVDGTIKLFLPNAPGLSGSLYSNVGIVTVSP